MVHKPAASLRQAFFKLATSFLKACDKPAASCFVQVNLRLYCTSLFRQKFPKTIETFQLIKTLPKNDERVRTLKSYLRSLQRKSFFESSKSIALRLEELLYYDRFSFWKQVTNFKRNSKKRPKILKNEVNHEEYVEYFSNLFSHSNILSNLNHILIDKKVLQYFESKSLNLKSIDCIFRIV